MMRPSDGGWAKKGPPQYTESMLHKFHAPQRVSHKMSKRCSAQLTKPREVMRGDSKVYKHVNGLRPSLKVNLACCEASRTIIMYSYDRFRFFEGSARGASIFSVIDVWCYPSARRGSSRGSPTTSRAASPAFARRGWRRRTHGICSVRRSRWTTIQSEEHLIET